MSMLKLVSSEHDGVVAVASKIYKGSWSTVIIEPELKEVPVPFCPVK